MKLKSFYREFGKRLKQLRLQANMSQEELAEWAGVSVATLSKLERGVVLPTLETATRIANALQLTLPELFTFGY